MACRSKTPRIINAARALRGIAPAAPKGGARFHFSLPGSVQGFLPESPDALRLDNTAGALACHILEPEGTRRAFTATFTPKENFSVGSYSMSACPTLHPGQTVRARWISPASNSGPIGVRLALKTYDENLCLKPLEGLSLIHISEPTRPY